MTEKVKREFLSRGKCEYDEAWVTGYLVFEDNEQKPIIISILTFDDYEDDEVDEQNIRDFYYYYVIPETVGRCAGITDAKGQDMFEGDIVKRGNRTWLVYYDTNYAQFRMKTYTKNGISWSEDFHTIPSEWCEIIGNIYDNPELLEWRD